MQREFHSADAQLGVGRAFCFSFLNMAWGCGGMSCRRGLAEPKKGLNATLSRG